MLGNIYFGTLKLITWIACSRKAFRATGAVHAAEGCMFYTIKELVRFINTLRAVEWVGLSLYVI